MKWQVRTSALISRHERDICNQSKKNMLLNTLNDDLKLLLLKRKTVKSTIHEIVNWFTMDDQ